MLHEIHDRHVWNEFLLAQPTQAGIFLQSWEWGEFQEKLGRKMWRIGITQRDTDENTDKHELVGVCGLKKMELPMGKSYLYSPRGPVFDQESGIRNQESGDGLVEYIKTLAKKEKGIFWRTEPTTALNTTANEISRSRNFVRTAPIQPTQTLIVDLAKSEDELLATMHEKTRYNIRLALRKGVTTKIATPHHKMSDRTFCGGSAEFDNFWQLLQETARRDGFRTHAREYYEHMLVVLGNSRFEIRDSKPISNIQYLISNDMNVRFHATYHGSTMLAAAIVAYFGDTATYLHGASSYEHRALMGPYALHWEMMKDAKTRGYKFYDFWGIKIGARGQGLGARDWSGMTRFKMGFATNQNINNLTIKQFNNRIIITYPGTFDLPFSKAWYTLYRFGRKMLP